MWKHPHPSKRLFRVPGRRPSNPKSAKSGEKTAECSPESKSGGSTDDPPCDATLEKDAASDESSDSPVSTDEKSGMEVVVSSNDGSSSKKKHRRRSRGKFIQKFAAHVGHQVNSLGNHLDEVFFPKPKPSVSNRIRVNNGVLLNNCESEEEHQKVVDEFLERVKDVNGEEGLRVAGFAYKPVHCDDHISVTRSESDNSEGDDSTTDKIVSLMEKAVHINRSEHDASVEVVSSTQPQAFHTVAHDGPPCSHCTTRLFHGASDTVITEENRRRFISDGPMYEEMARLCQEYAQELMQCEGDLEWITICDDEARGEPVRALVHVDHHASTGASSRSGSASSSDSDVGEESPTELDSTDAEPKPTLLIATGKGKVRAGIFSRQHLMVSGIEPSTALPMVREAARREMNIAILDPNARGDRQGMVTFEQSLGELFGHWEEEDSDAGSHCNHVHDLYVLAHSQSGTQLVQYLLARAEYYLPRIRAIAFTDSTHNIQWTKRNASVKNLLESSACVYVRSSNVMRDSNWQEHKPGDVVKTDQFWQHRFGSIRTMWAGTKEHSLTNWTAHSHIWDHFDRHLHTGTYVSTFSVTNSSSHDNHKEEEKEKSEDSEEDEQKPEASESTTPCNRGVPVGVVTV